MKDNSNRGSSVEEQLLCGGDARYTGMYIGSLLQLVQLSMKIEGCLLHIYSWQSDRTTRPKTYVAFAYSTPRVKRTARLRPLNVCISL